MQVRLWAEPLPSTTFSLPLFVSSTASQTEAAAEAWVPASPMVVLEFPEWPEIATLQQQQPNIIMISIPVDSRVAFTNARRRRHLLQADGTVIFMYNPPGTAFQLLQAFWFSTSLKRWEPFEKQSIKPELFKVIVPVSGLLLASNSYKIQMAVFGVPSNSGDRRLMIPNETSSATEEWELAYNAAANTKTPSAKIQTTKTPTTSRIATTTTEEMPGTTPQPETSKGNKKDETLYIGIGIAAAVLVIFILCLVWICKRKLKEQQKQQEDSDEHAFFLAPSAQEKAQPDAARKMTKNSLFHGVRIERRTKFD